MFAREICRHGSEKLRFISFLDKKLSNKLFDSFYIIIQSPDCGMPDKTDFLDRVEGGSQVRYHAGHVSACPPRAPQGKALSRNQKTTLRDGFLRSWRTLSR